MQRTYKELSTNLPWRRDICAKTHSACSQSDNASWCFQHHSSCTWDMVDIKVAWEGEAIHKCNVCRLYSAKPFEAQVTAQMPSFRTEGSRPFEVTGLDFAGPLYYRVSKNENGKCYILIIIYLCSFASYSLGDYKELNCRRVPKKAKCFHFSKIKTTIDHIR